MTERDCRYQAAIVRDGHLLLIQHKIRASGRRYWIIPGGGLEPGESEEACVAREAREETGLDVAIVRLLAEDSNFVSSVYRRARTYLCAAEHGEPEPGTEPEIEHDSRYQIVAVRWFDLRNPASWPAEVTEDAETMPQLVWMREMLGYT